MFIILTTSVVLNRKVSVMDVSKKYGMEYRLLHSIAYGRSWYGCWGYEFGKGSYGATLDDYQKAITNLSAIPLSLFTFHGRRPATCLQELIALYQSISDSKLETLKDLFSFIFLLIRNRRNGSCKSREREEPEDSCINPSCQWSKEDVKRVEEVMIKVLLVKPGGDSGWVSRRALKGALSKTGSPELLDHCIKHLGGKVTSNGLVVNRRYSNSTIEFRYKRHMLFIVFCSTFSKYSYL